eukprot:1129423-Pyramimonas_sp.AAC.1
MQAEVGEVNDGLTSDMPYIQASRLVEIKTFVDSDYVKDWTVEDACYSCGHTYWHLGGATTQGDVALLCQGVRHDQGCRGVRGCGRGGYY